MKRNILKYLLIQFLFIVSVFPVSALSARFTWTRTSNCFPSVVSFVNNSSQGTGITYYWDFGLGSVTTTSDPGIREQVYTRAGSYTVKLKVSDGISSDSTSAIITIATGPAASFTADRQEGCLPLAVNYTSTSRAGDASIKSVVWDLRNGETRQGENVSYTYNNSGIYEIVMKVTDSNGCSSILGPEKAVTVYERPSAAFSASDTFACSAPVSIAFRNESTGASALKYFWNFGNGKTSEEINQSAVYDSSGSYDVSLKVTDAWACTDSVMKKSYITVGYPKGFIEVYDGSGNKVERPFLCDGDYRFSFSVKGLPDYTWKITNNGITKVIKGGNNLDYKITGSGILDVKLVYGKNGFCTDSISASYGISYIKAAFRLDDTIFCSVPSSINLKSESENVNQVSWYVGGKLVSEKADTSYSITKDLLPAETWAQIYSHEINYANVPVRLVVSNGGVCFDSVTAKVKIALPVARFMPDRVSGCIPLNVVFSDSSKSVFPIDSRVFHIGNDSIVTISGSPVNYTFSKTGVYQVTEVIKSGICRDTSHIVLISAGDKVTADITADRPVICNGSTLHLTAVAGDEKAVDNWRIFSPGLFDFSSANRPDTLVSINTDTTGFHDVTLTADFNGCLSTIMKKDFIRVTGTTGSFSTKFSCDSSYIYHFKQEMSPASSFSWRVDTAVFDNTDSVRYVFPKSGNYEVSLTANDYASGCITTVSKIIRVRSVKASFTVNDSTLCAGDSLKLDASLSRDYISECFNEGFLWSFGDDSPPRRTFSTHYDHIYTSRGIDTVRLVTTGENGCADTARKVVKVFSPQGSFTTDITNGCLPSMNIKFNNTSTDTTIISWVWNFGDNSSDSTNTPVITHLYSNNEPKFWYPTLTVYDAYQCSSGQSVTVRLEGVGAGFQADDNAVCEGSTVSFTPTEQDLTSTVWDYGDGSQPGNNGIHTYTNAGKYNVTLTATKGGCTSVFMKEAYVSVERAAAGFTFGDSIYYCYPDTLNFRWNDSSGSQPVEWIWKFGSVYLNDRSSPETEYTFTRPGNYPVYLSVRTLNGCTATESHTVTVKGPEAEVTFAPKEICYNQDVAFSVDSLKDVSSWKLFYGDGSSDTVRSSVHRYTSRGKMLPYIQLINSGCDALLPLDTLTVSMVKADFSGNDGSLYLCLGNRLDLQNKSAYASSFSWYLDNVLKSSSVNYGNILFDRAGEYYIKLIAKAAGGCTDTIVKKFTAGGPSAFAITGDSIICQGGKALTLSVVPPSGSSILWSPSAGLSNPTAFTVTVNPSSSTSYTASVTNMYGCVSTASKEIRVNEPFDLQRYPASDTSINIGESLQLKILTSATGVSYVWTPDYRITCTNCSDPWVTPLQTTTYTARVKNECFDFTETFNIEVIADFYLEAPTAFTPNGDSNNDLFSVEYRNIETFSIKVFNRWGDIVYSSDNPGEGWNGDVNGHPQNSGTYKYVMKAVTIHGYSFEKRGEFLLLR